MGAPFKLAAGKGPVIHEPIRTRAQIDALRVCDPHEGLGYVLEALHAHSPRAQRPRAPHRLGRAPSPSSYLVEGGESAHLVKTKTLMYREPESWHALMEKLPTVVAKYLVAQVAAGAQAVQLFDSWVGALSPQDYVTYVQPHVARILTEVSTCGVR